MADDLQFDWDEANVRHLRRHRVAPEEFEQVLRNDPLDFDYQTERDEPRYKSVGVTDQGRVLVVVWTVREHHIRAVTAYAAGRPLQRFFRLYGR